MVSWKKSWGFLSNSWDSFSPSQSHDKFEFILENFESNLQVITQNNLFVVLAVRDFNAKSMNWNANDRTSFRGLQIDSLTQAFSLYQMVKEPTHKT